MSTERNVRFVDGTTFVGEDEIAVTTAVPSKTIEKSQLNEREASDTNTPTSTPTSVSKFSNIQQTTTQNSSGQSFQTTLNPPEVSNQTAQPLVTNESNNVNERPKRTMKPSVHVRRLLEHGNELPPGLQQYSKALLPSETQGPLQSKGLLNLRDDEAESGTGALAQKISHGFALSALSFESNNNIDIPESRKQAMESKNKEEWLEAEGKELLNLVANQTFGELIPRSQAKTPSIPLQWVYDVKRDEHGNNMGFKARVVVRGDKQEKFVNYEETFASVLKSASRNILLAVAAQNNWHIRQSDFKGAYLNAGLDEKIYVQQPPGYAIPGKEDYVYRLKKALYGLKQAARLWFLAISGYLTDVMGFTQCSSDQAVFIHRRGRKEVILAIHVDDDLIMGNDLEEILEVEAQLDAKFPMKVLGDATHYLGISIERNREARIISLGQGNYIDGLVALCGLEDAKSVSTPLPLGVKLGKEYCPTHSSDIIDMQNVPYRQVIGGLMYIANGTRPDCSYATNILAQVASNPGRIHWEAAKHIVRYLKGTRERQLTYGAGPTGLYGYSDASFASPDLGHKSMSGYAFMVNGGAISWSAKKQSVVALSTAKAEYLAMCHATKELLWIRSFITEVFRPLKNAIRLFVDNQSAIAMAKYDTFHSRTKHIALPYLFIRHHVADNHLSITWIDTHSNLADAFTKALDKKKTADFACLLGLLA